MKRFILKINMEIKPLRLSVSSIKKFNASKAQWVWKYIVWIDEFTWNVNTIMWSMFHKYIETGKHWPAYKILEDEKVSMNDRNNILEWYWIATKHYDYYSDKIEWINEYKIEFEYLWVPFLWFVDWTNAKVEEWKLVVTKDTIMRDWKCVSNFCDPQANRPNPWSWLNTYEEYELQAWLYMIGTWIRICEFPEFRKKTWKYSWTGKNRKEYSPDQWHKIIRFVNTRERFKKMEDKWNPIINDIKETYDEYKHLIPLLKINEWSETQIK